MKLLLIIPAIYIYQFFNFYLHDEFENIYLFY